METPDTVESTLDIKALVLDSSAGAAELLAATLRRDFDFAEVEFTNTTHKAVQSFTESQYNLCFISDAFSLEETQVFMRDLAKIRRDDNCLFVQVRDAVPDDVDRRSLRDSNIFYIISRRGTHADRVGLEEALVQVLFAKKLEEKVTTVNDTMQMVLTEIDRAAEDLKRGREAKINKLPINFVDYQTDFHQRVLDEYYEALSDKAESAAPNEIDRLDVPEGVLSRQLPNLSKDTYNGASHRVWRKLKKKYGTKDSE